MKRLLFKLALLAVPLGALAQNAGDLTKFLPNTHDGWQNLTYGVADSTNWNTNHKPLEVQISGNTIHVAWMEQAIQNDGNYPLYYRRSLDNGKTWENPRIIAVIDKTHWTSSSGSNAIGGCNSHWMRVDGQNVHFALPFWSKEGKHSFSYIRSTDGGATFTTQLLWETTASYIDASRPHVASDGQTVVVAANVDADDPYVWTSFDGGTTFKLAKINENYKLVDVQVSGKRWTILGFLDSGHAYDRWSRVFFSTSSDGGETVSTENLAHAASNGKTYSTSSCLDAPSYAYHPQMVQQGNTIDLMYIGSLSDGNEGDPDPGYDKNHTIHRRSTDGGKTWTEARYMPESTGGYGTIAAKGDNVYVYTTCKGKHAVYHSHDGGKTWEVQQQGILWGVNDEWNPSNSFHLYIAPDDVSGQHVYLTGSRAYLAESKDGFRTLCRNFSIGSEVWRWDGGSCIRNNSLIVLLDNEGMEQWFMWYRPLYNDNNYFWSVCHRRNEPVAKTGSTNMALNITNPRNKYNQVEASNQVIVPMTTSLHEIKKATTVECWVRPDTISTIQIASLTHGTNNSYGSIYNGGWSLQVSADHDYHYVIAATMTTELSVDGVGTGMGSGYSNRYRIYDKGFWHHVALTYDAVVEKDNLRLYVDGMLLTVATLKGDILQGDNPIAIGGSSGYNENNALVDNFAVWDRALSQEELRSHIYQAPTGKEQGCRLLLTFDGSLQDQSPYHNDGLAIRNLVLTPHDGIRAPHPQFIASKDLTGKIVNLTDATADGEVCWWLKPYPSGINQGKNYYVDGGGAYSTSTKQHEQIDFGRYSGNFPVNMVVRPTGNCNAYASAEQIINIGGLSRVLPEKAGRSNAVKLQIQGGFRVTYSNQPKVVLKQGTTEIEGKWLVERGYDSDKIISPNDLAPASFNLSEAPTGKYDVIVDSDTLRQAFTMEEGELPNVSVQVTGREKVLWSKYCLYNIDFTNASNTAAYNTPFFLFISDKDSQLDVSFDFPVECYGEGISQEIKDFCKDLENGVVINTPQYGPMRCFWLNIPYIAPNGDLHLTFRVRLKNNNTITPDVDMVYACAQPWGAFDPTYDWDAHESESSRFRVRDDDEIRYNVFGLDEYDSDAAMCIVKDYFWAWFRDAAIGSIPGVGCIYAIEKHRQAKKEGHSWAISNMYVTLVSAGISCVGTFVDLASLGGTWLFHVGCELLWGAINNVVGFATCLASNPKYKHLVGVRSLDPNEMIGPWGPDDNAHYIQPIHQMPYMITFENKSSATAPANEVFITDTLDLSKFDAETFNFSSFGWADNTYSVGGSHNKEFTRDVEYKVNGHDILVRVSGQFDPETGVARWAFVSLEKNGNELDDVMNGFLLPNNDNGVGEGYVTFTIEHKQNPANGSTVSNKATIIFDANDPIVTNTYVNTFDTDYPTSKITKAEEKDGQIVVTIEGSDKTSGIDHYTVYAFINNSEEPQVVASGITTQQASFACEPGTKYGLCVVATDRVGWNEAKDLKVEKTVTTSGSSASTYDLAVAAAGYATFFDSQNNYVLPEGLKASTVSGVSGGKLSYQSVGGNIVPKGTAVLIEASSKSAATYTLTSTNDNASYTGDNLLHGSDNATTTSTDGSNLYYKLAYGPSGTSLAQSFGWFWGAQNGAPFSIEGHRAWLAIPKAAGARAYLISGEEAAVDEITSGPYEKQEYLDLQGRRIEKPTQPGIYFLNGRKIVIR